MYIDRYTERSRTIRVIGIWSQHNTIILLEFRRSGATTIIVWAGSPFDFLRRENKGSEKYFHGYSFTFYTSAGDQLWFFCLWLVESGLRVCQLSERRHWRQKRLQTGDWVTLILDYDRQHTLLDHQRPNQLVRLLCELGVCVFSSVGIRSNHLTINTRTVNRQFTDSSININQSFVTTDAHRNSDRFDRLCDRKDDRENLVKMSGTDRLFEKNNYFIILPPHGHPVLRVKDNSVRRWIPNYE